MKKEFFYSLIILFFSQSVLAQRWPSMATTCYEARTLLKNSTGNNLYVGGDFCEINGNSDMQGIAMWDGISWHSLDTGITNNNAFPYVMDLEFYNNFLYVAGDFTYAGPVATHNIAKWTGASWLNLGVGTDSAVYDMCNYNGLLYVGGLFSMAGTANANGLATWNGVSWSAVPNWTNEKAVALGVFNGELYAGTRTGKILKFNGATWQLLTTLLTTSNMIPIHCMKTVNNRLYIGGDFTGTATLNSPNLIYYNGASWNNSGISNYGSGWPYTMVNDLYNDNGTLFITGIFDSINNYLANGFAYYSGSSWNVLVGGPYTGNCLEVFQGAIYAGSRNEIDIYDSTLSISEQQNVFSVNVFPNPSSDFIHVSFSGKRIDDAEVFDVNGNIVDVFLKPASDIFIGDLSPGIYFLRIESGENIYSGKFIRSEK